MSEERDLYDVLGVAREATQEDIKLAYRRKARQCHPDVCKDSDATQKFQEVLAAYEVLSDCAKRNSYDETGERAAPQYRTFAEGFLMQAALAWIHNPANDTSYADLIHHLNTLLDKHIPETRATVLEGDAVKARLARALGKLKHKGGGRDFLRIAIESKIENIEEQQERACNALGGFEYARALLNEYDYEKILAIMGAGRPIVNQIWVGANQVWTAT